jgi:ribosomal protein L7Ae-like RNA K-turn-binding protein
MDTSTPKLDTILKELIGKSEVIVGSAAVTRSCQRGKLSLVVMAADAAPDLLESIRAEATAKAIRVVVVQTRKMLAELASQRRPTAAIGLVRHSDDLLLRLAPGVPIDWDVDLLIWFHSLRFTHLEGGYKQATLRVGLRRPFSFDLGVVDGGTAQLRGVVHINEVGWLRWFEVESRPDILRHEYPNSWDALAKEMHQVYPLLDHDTWLTYYRFEYERM